MAQVIRSSLTEFNNMQYGSISNEGYNYVQNTLNQAMESGLFTNNMQLFNEMQANVNKYAYASIVMAETSMNGTGSLMDDGIYPIYDVSRFVSTSLYNQQYLISEPALFNAAKNGVISGWSETLPEHYFDNRDLANERYREVMDGQIQWADEDSGEEDVFKVYFADDFCENPLKFNEKIIMRQNWERLSGMVFGDKEDALDPTDQFGGML